MGWQWGCGTGLPGTPVVLVELDGRGDEDLERQLGHCQSWSDHTHKVTR